MAAELNHTIVPAHDPQASAKFLADILGLPVVGVRVGVQSQVRVDVQRRAGCAVVQLAGGPG